MMMMMMMTTMMAMTNDYSCECYDGELKNDKNNRDI